MSQTSKLTLLMLSAAALLVLTGCSSVSVNYDYDNNVDFNQYKTYTFAPTPENLTKTNAAQAQIHSGILDKRIKASIDMVMADRGLDSFKGGGDLLVVFHLGVADKLQVTDWGYSYSPYYYRGAYGGRQIDVYQYQEGQLIIDLVDAKSKQLVWRGTGTKALSDRQLTPEQEQVKLDEVVWKIMESFPPN